MFATFYACLTTLDLPSVLWCVTLLLATTNEARANTVADTREGTHMESAHRITRKDVESIGAKIIATGNCLPTSAEMESRGWEYLGYNAGVYGWNWTAWLSKDHATVLMASYRNTPKSAEYVAQSELASII